LPRVTICMTYKTINHNSTNARALPRVLKFHFSIQIYNSQLTYLNLKQIKYYIHNFPRGM
jgi:hypothetical protein